MGNGAAHMKKILKKGFDAGDNVLIENPGFMELLNKMLDFNPSKRVSPSEVL